MKRTLAEQMAADADAPIITSLDMAKVRECVSTLLQLKQKEATLSKTLQAMQENIRTIETQTLPTMLDEVGVSKMVIDGHPLSISTEYYPHVSEDNQPGFFAWLRQNNLDGMIKTEVKVAFGKGDDKKAQTLAEQLLKRGLPVNMKQGIHPGTLKAFVRERMEQGAPLPISLSTNPVRIVKIK